MRQGLTVWDGIYYCVTEVDQSPDVEENLSDHVNAVFLTSAAHKYFRVLLYRKSVSILSILSQKGWFQPTLQIIPPPL